MICPVTRTYIGRGHGSSDIRQYEAYSDSNIFENGCDLGRYKKSKIWAASETLYAGVDSCSLVDRKDERFACLNGPLPKRLVFQGVIGIVLTKSGEKVH